MPYQQSKLSKNLTLYVSIIAICTGGFMIGSIYENTKYTDLNNKHLEEKQRQIELLQDSVLPAIKEVSVRFDDISSRLILLTDRLDILTMKAEESIIEIRSSTEIVKRLMEEGDVK